jgi:hypothetical protein
MALLESMRVRIEPFAALATPYRASRAEPSSCCPNGVFFGPEFTWCLELPSPWPQRERHLRVFKQPKIGRFR